MPHLFTQGDFTLHSGAKSKWKVECDALTDEDWQTLAEMIDGTYSFHTVHGVPRGGLVLAEKLKPYCKENGKSVLIVDDVLTTGGSMEEKRNEVWKEGWKDIQGVVIFSRTNKLPYWIDALWTYQAKMIR